MSPPDKKSYALWYRTEKVDKTKYYASLQQIIDDKTLPKTAQFDLTKRRYTPLMTFRGFSLYDNSFSHLNKGCGGQTKEQLIKCIKKEYPKEELND